MTRLFRRRLVLLGMPTLLLALGGCYRSTATVPPPSVPMPTAGPTGMPGPGAGGSAASPIKDIMNKLTKGPTSLTQVIGNELKTDPPPWDTMQPQTQEFAKLAANMGQYNPPKGSKDSWTQLTASYAASAAALDKAAQAKDKQAAVAAHETLSNSCMACHREHRGGGRMGGPPGGPMGGPPGGPPPGNRP